MEELLKKQLDRCHTIIVCLIAFLFMCGLLIFVYFYNSDIKLTKEIVKIESNDGNAFYQHGDNNTITEDKGDK